MLSILNTFEDIYKMLYQSILGVDYCRTVAVPALSRIRAGISHGSFSSP